MKHVCSAGWNIGGWKIECPDGDRRKGLGWGSSSNLRVLFAAARACIMGGPGVDLDPDAISQEALAGERLAAGGAAVGADDVRPTVGGGVGVTHTFPLDGQGLPRNRHGLTIDTCYTRIPYDRRRLPRHVVVATDPRGGRHHVPDLLGHLFEDPKAKTYVRQINRSTDAAVLAVKSNAFGELADAINAYRRIFDRWTHGAFTAAVEEDVKTLFRRMGRGNVGWKPCGAGACKSLILVVDEPKYAISAIQHLHEMGWVAGPLEVTDGLRAEVSDSGRRIRISAGHRVDLIGAADLGQDPRIGVAGRCLACAVHPRTEWILSFQGVDGETNDVDESASGVQSFSMAGALSQRGGNGSARVKDRVVRALQGFPEPARYRG